MPVDVRQNNPDTGSKLVGQTAGEAAGIAK